MVRLQLACLILCFVLFSCKKDSAFLSDQPAPPAPKENVLDSGSISESSILEEKHDVTPSPSDIDIVWIIDTSGSMNNNLKLVKDNLMTLFQRFDFSGEQSDINFRMTLLGVDPVSKMFSEAEEFSSTKLRENIENLGEDEGRRVFGENFVAKISQLGGTAAEQPLMVAINAIQWASTHKIGYPDKEPHLWEEYVYDEANGLSHKFMLDFESNQNSYNESHRTNQFGKKHFEFFATQEDEFGDLLEKSKKRWTVVIPITDEDALSIANGRDEETRKKTDSAPKFPETYVKNYSEDDGHEIKSYFYGCSNGDAGCVDGILSAAKKAERRGQLKCELYKRVQRMDHELAFLGREKGFIKFYPIINLESDLHVGANLKGNADSPLRKFDKVGHRIEMASEVTRGKAFSLNPPRIEVSGKDPACAQQCSDDDCIQQCMNNKYYINIMKDISGSLQKLVQNRFPFDRTPDLSTVKVYIQNSGEERKLLDPSQYEIQYFSSAEGAIYEEYDSGGCDGSSSAKNSPIGTKKAPYVVVKGSLLEEDSRLFIRYQQK